MKRTKLKLYSRKEIKSTENSRNDQFLTLISFADLFVDFAGMKKSPDAGYLQVFKINYIILMITVKYVIGWAPTSGIKDDQ